MNLEVFSFYYLFVHVGSNSLGIHSTANFDSSPFRKVRCLAIMSFRMHLSKVVQPEELKTIIAFRSLDASDGRIKEKGPARRHIHKQQTINHAQLETI